MGAKALPWSIRVIQTQGAAGLAADLRAMEIATLAVVQAVAIQAAVPATIKAAEPAAAVAAPSMPVPIKTIPQAWDQATVH